MEHLFVGPPLLCTARHVSHLLSHASSPKSASKEITEYRLRHGRSFFLSGSAVKSRSLRSRRSFHFSGGADLKKEAVCEADNQDNAGSKPKGLDYASSGVDIELEGAAVKALITSLGKSKSAPRKPGEKGALVPHPGGFSGLIEFGKDALLALCTDGVGSKLSIANELRYWETVGIDCMAMNVNDLLCVGAEPLAFVDYVAIPKPDPQVHAALGRSLAEACRQARVSLCGGETASLPGIVTELDLSGTALGWLPRGDQLTGERISPGDVLIGLPSSGIHSNGYTLVRKVVEVSKADIRAPAPFDPSHPTRTITRFDSNSNSNSNSHPTLGEVLLNPTRIYVDPLVDLFKACRDGQSPCEYTQLHGLAHITGGGLSNLLRLHPDHGYVIEDPLPVPPEFDWMESEGGVQKREMYRTFNMGLGIVIVVAKEAADAVEAYVSSRLPGSRRVGTVIEGHKAFLSSNPAVLFDHY